MTARLTWKELWSPVVGLVGAFLIALVIAIYIMQAPPGDLRDLLLFLLTSSIPSLLVGYLVFLVGRKWLHSIQQKILLAYSLGVVIFELLSGGHPFPGFG